MCEAYGISLNTLLTEYTEGQAILMSVASHILAPEMPEDNDGTTRTEKARKKRTKSFKDMTANEYLEFSPSSKIN